MRGVRRFSRRRSALLVVTVLAAIAAVLTALQIGHTTADGDVHAPLPALLGADTYPGVTDILPPAEAETGGEDTDLPSSGIHTQMSLTVLAGALAMLLGLLARRRTGGHGPTDSGADASTRTRPPAPTPLLPAPIPVLSRTCVLRV